MGSSDKKKKKKDGKKDKKVEKKSQVIELKVEIHCKKCGEKVLKAISELKEVSAVDVDASKNKVTVTGTMEADELLKKVRKMGKTAELWKEKDESLSESQYFTILELPGYRLIMSKESSNCALM